MPSLKLFFANEFKTLVSKGICFACILFVIGIPVLSMWEFIFFLMVIVVIFTGTAKNELTKLLLCLGVAVLVLGVKIMLPSADIEEGHNVFLSVGDEDELLRQTLPKPVFEHMAAQFLEQYPRNNWCAPTEQCWRRKGFSLPEQTFSFSADSIFQEKKYSRVVQSIDFYNRPSFRGGYINSLTRNWYAVSDIKRETIPFFVMYELSGQSIGSSLCFKGDVFWETLPGEYELLNHGSMKCKEIGSSDGGKKVFGISILLDQPLSMKLEQSPKLKNSGYVRNFLSVFGVLAIIFLSIKVNYKRLIIPVGIILLTTIAIPLKALHYFSGYTTYSGGNDGLLHESFGRTILKEALEGNILEALKGVESVYYFMPGLRYFKVIERVLFGDTNFGELAFLIFYSLAFYLFLRSVLSFRVANILFLLFLFFDRSFRLHNSFTLLSFTHIALVGEAEILGYLLFLFSLVLFLKYHDAPSEDFIRAGILGNLLMALAIFVRPNLVLGAGFFLLFQAWWLITSNRVRDFIIVSLGFLPFFIMPLHNYYYGGTFELLTSASTIPENLKMRPLDYYQGAKAMLSGDFKSEQFVQVKDTFFLWVDNRWWRSLFFLLSLVPLLPIKGISWKLRSLAFATLGLQPVLFFWHANGRYALLAWLVSITTAFAVIGFLYSARKLRKISKEESLSKLANS